MDIFQVTREDYYRKVNKMVESMKDDDDNEVGLIHKNDLEYSLDDVRR